MAKVHYKMELLMQLHLTDVIIFDEFGMIDCKIFLTAEHLCKRFSTKDGQYKPWGGRHCTFVW